MMHRFGLFAALLIGSGIVSWSVRESRRGRLRATLVGRGVAARPRLAALDRRLRAGSAAA